MIRSMTGFGSASAEYNNKTISVEIKSVNSKFMDLSLRLPTLYKEKEFDMRSELGRILERGKIEIAISIDWKEASKKTSINAPLVKLYYDELKSISEKLQINSTDYLKLILELPDVLTTEKTGFDEAEWSVVMEIINRAVKDFQTFRETEGKAMERDIKDRISAIEKGIIEIEKFEPARLENIRKRLLLSLEDFIQANNIDRNRLEQELIYYIEKFDVSEEKVRLRSHCDFFLKTVKEESSGKKLAFIAQEIGREINTIGSKANDASMQQIVVRVKDELEKIKELVLNIL